MMAAHIRDESIRQYLLGKASEELREEIAEALVSDDNSLAHRLEELENELFDRRLRRNLDPQQIEDMRQGLRWTSRLRRKLGIVTSLSELSREEVRSAWRYGGYDSSSERLSAWFLALLPSPAWAPAAVAAMLVFTALVSWQAGRMIEADRFVAEAWVEAGPVPRGGERVATFEVRDLARLSLDVTGEPFVTFDAALFRVGATDSIWLRRGLEPTDVDNRIAVRLDVPGSLLEPGVYYVELSGVDADGGTGFVDRYPFRVDPR